MKYLLRVLSIPVLFAVMATFSPSATAAAPINNVDGNALPVPEYGGTIDAFTLGATHTSPGINHGVNGSTWGWDMFYTWTAPLSGAARLDLCQSSSPLGGPWHLMMAPYVDWISPLTRQVATSTGCVGAAMPQGDFTATAGTKYMIVVGAQYTQNAKSMLRLTYVPQLAAAPQLVGSASVGQTLSVTDPTWVTPASTHELAGPTWKRCAVGGAPCTTLTTQRPMSRTYTVQPADLGSVIHVEYTATSAAGSTDTRTGSTAPIAAKPVDADGDGIPDELVSVLGIPTGAAGLTSLCTTYTLCKDDRRQSSIFTSWNSMSIIDGALLDVLLGSAKPELLVADQSTKATAKKAETCDGAGGNDVCVGSKGPDTCIAYIGDDFCLGNRGADTCISKAGVDVCYGGEGPDRCLINPPKVAGLPLPVATCDGGIGNDTCRAAVDTLVKGLKLTKPGMLRMNCNGGAGNDTCGVAKAPASPRTPLMRSTCTGGAGKDLCVAKGAGSWAAGIFAAHNAVMNCIGGAGADTLWTLNGKPGDTINGGGQGTDTCIADVGDKVRGCGRTLLWKVSPAHLALINGTLAQQAKFARESTVTYNGKTVDDKTATELAKELNDNVTRLNTLLESQMSSMRSLLDQVGRS